MPTQFESEESFVKPMLAKNCIKQTMVTVLIMNVIVGNPFQQQTISDVPDRNLLRIQSYRQSVFLFLN
ncbi:MAG: hypothetical protein JGK24_05910 [Microcoleus sp. PH2017_29_MFU_D_A]|uniref:hypothetical protein n=1 Tax=unclassified Microcoleus TaxID=2642155 RepID=UPI001D5667BD|nr:MULTISPECIES: hypothetical protein [unclassified Microcoleus]MCC3419941.1 hypothetical protein [Microcoleus sp. PH2017_07_MST_O_A]MCC3440406.1 hypothetical protein [Microcoleus sp. PH2017_03_ELD_O_A]MCC3509028.1 hypothetical protein [Microcoleus sp. PH2017_17_BER_D_A]TAG14241.1 MAG: hypothetical protein EAZ39_25325 [Oscillatoriales cyanobacterium]MCC3471434.1 hypothetical protein [Microcoleus sp. PH2017_13_LAR_U_A]